MAWAWVQGNQAQSNAVAFPGNVTAGNTIIVSALANNGSGSATCSDALGNSYVVDKSVVDSVQGVTTIVFRFSNLPSGGSTNTVTVAWGGATTGLSIEVHEYSGLANTSPVDVSSSTNNGTGSAATDGATSGSATTLANDLVFGVAVDSSQGTSSIAHGTGFTAREQDTGDGNPGQDCLTEDKNSSATSTAATWTFGVADNYDAVMVAYKQASGGGGSTPVVLPATSIPIWERPGLLCYFRGLKPAYGR